jgi:hypothetical protein
LWQSLQIDQSRLFPQQAHQGEKDVEFE